MILTVPCNKLYCLYCNKLLALKSLKRVPITRSALIVAPCNLSQYWDSVGPQTLGHGCYKLVQDKEKHIYGTFYFLCLVITSS